MAMRILDTCINCGACEPDCPNEAINEGDELYVIDPEKCTECFGKYDDPKCIEHCPVDDCIIVDPDRQESREELLARCSIRALAPKQLIEEECS